jgi:hypothetical protein
MEIPKEAIGLTDLFSSFVTGFVGGDDDESVVIHDEADIKPAEKKKWPLPSWGR